ncbi:hypothetical protein ACHAWX_007628, partial [Stephanocyclus meneghinianus]
SSKSCKPAVNVPTKSPLYSSKSHKPATNEPTPRSGDETPPTKSYKPVSNAPSPHFGGETLPTKVHEFLFPSVVNIFLILFMHTLSIIVTFIFIKKSQACYQWANSSKWWRNPTLKGITDTEQGYSHPQISIPFHLSPCIVIFSHLLIRPRASSPFLSLLRVIKVIRLLQMHHLPALVQKFHQQSHPCIPQRAISLLLVCRLLVVMEKFGLQSHLHTHQRVTNLLLMHRLLPLVQNRLLQSHRYPHQRATSLFPTVHLQDQHRCPHVTILLPMDHLLAVVLKICQLIIQQINLCVTSLVVMHQLRIVAEKFHLQCHLSRTQNLQRHHLREPDCIKTPWMTDD